MSSEYKIFCLSHNPVIVFGDCTWNRPEMALEAVRDRTGPAAEHPNCRLLVGRYSASLIEVCCPTSAHILRHGADLWVDAHWLRLIALASAGLVMHLQIPECWTAIARPLAKELGVEFGIEGS